MKRRVIIHVDLSGSTASNRTASAGDRMNEQRLQDIESAFRLVDPSLVRHTAAGDSVTLLGEGSKAVDLYREAVGGQGRWRALPKGLASRISMGFADLVMSADGDYRHTEIDYAHRLLALCPEGHVVVTESLGVRLIEAEYHASLIPKVAEDLKGFEDEPRRYFEVDGAFVRSEGSRLPTVRDTRKRRDADLVAATKSHVGLNGYWKVLAAVALAGIFILVAILIFWGRK